MILKDAKNNKVLRYQISVMQILVITVQYVCLILEVVVNSARVNQIAHFMITNCATVIFIL